MKLTLEEISDFYELYPEFVGKIDVKSQKGFHKITNAGITAKDSEILQIKLENNLILEGSPNHRVIRDEEWVYLKDLNINDVIKTEYGYKKIKHLSKLDFREDLYDIEVDTVKEYYSNGIVSHNSAFNDALFYALFGKAFRKIKSGSLINRITKKRLAVEVAFKIDAQRYKVIRGMKPNKFEIYIEAKDEEEGTDEFTLIEQRASVKDYQKFLEEEILNINEIIFRQLIVLGANLPSSKPFMELSQQEKESLFQVLTDTSIFGHIKTNIKNRISDKKAEFKKYEYKRDILKSSLDSEKLMIEQAEKQNEDFKQHHTENLKVTKENIQTTEENIKKYENGLEKLKELKVIYDDKITRIKDKQENLYTVQETNKQSIKSKRNNIEKDYYEAIKEIDSIYNMLGYDKEENTIKHVQELLIDAKNAVQDLENKVNFIEGAEKSAINCSSCSTTNYLTDISEEEVQKKESYIREIESKKMEVCALSQDETNLKEALLRKKQEDYKKYLAEKEEQNKIRLNKEDNLNKEIAELEQKEIEINKEINDALVITNTYKEKLLNGKRLKENLSELKNNLIYYNDKFKELQSIKMVEINYDSIKNKQKDMEILIKKINSINTYIDNLNYLENLIGANNLKGVVIKRQIPFLNKGINHFLEEFSMLGYSFVIDENFKERLISRDEDSEFNQLSNGQKARISFSIMFALLKLIEERNGVKTNILVLDEILDSSVDAAGREELLNILKTEFTDTKNVIIISHNPEIKEKIELFDRLIHVSKDNYSTINTEIL